MRNGLQKATQAGFRNIHIEGDGKIIIQAIKGKIQITWQLDFIIKYIKVFMSKADQITIYHIFREANFAANWIANLGHPLPSTGIWTSSLSHLFSFILGIDNLGKILVKMAA